MTIVEKKVRVDAETGDIVPDCGLLDCRLPKNHTGPHMPPWNSNLPMMFFYDPETKTAHTPEAWYRDHPS